RSPSCIHRHRADNVRAVGRGADRRGMAGGRGNWPRSADAPSSRRRMGLMRGISIRGACRRRLWGGGMGLLLTCWLILSPSARGSDVPDYAPAHPQLPIPLGSTRPEDGGPFVYAQYVMYRQTDPLA